MTKCLICDTDLYFHTMHDDTCDMCIRLLVKCVFSEELRYFPAERLRQVLKAVQSHQPTIGTVALVCSEMIK